MMEWINNSVVAVAQAGSDSLPACFSDGGMPWGTWAKIVALAVVQGVTEFLPISSSGHLALAGKMMNVDSPGVAMEVFLHGGTVLSIILFYRRKICELVDGAVKGDKQAWRYCVAVVVSAIPAGLAYAKWGDEIENAYGSTLAIGCALLFTGALICVSEWARSPRLTARAKQEEAGDGSGDVNWWRALAVGVAQAAAMLPGVSRSGSTISIARLLKVGSRQAAEFSFLMSLPVLIGANLIKGIELFGGKAGEAASGDFSGAHYFAGAAVSFIVGYFALSLLVRMLSRGKFWWFGVYCFAVGAIAAAASFFR